jgi:uncharacterized protein YdeI (YjbR/CyaY-like superfamily)
MSAEERLDAVSRYIEHSAEFAQPILSHLREVIHKGAPGCAEAMKWSMPFFVYKGVILANMAAFKAHCSFGLWGTSVVEGLREDGVAQGGSMGSFGKITSLTDLPPRKKLIEYVKQATVAIDSGERTKAWSRPKVAKAEPQIPTELAAALTKNDAAARKFQTMTPGYRREYCEWIAEGRRQETREKRAASAVDWIAEEKSRNWKYE